MGRDVLTQIEAKLYEVRVRGLEPVAIVLSRQKKQEFGVYLEPEDLFGESSGTAPIAYKGLPIITSDSLKNPEEPYVAC